MKRVVQVNPITRQLQVDLPENSHFKEGDLIEIKKSSVRRIAYSGVVGDLFHYGHLQSLQFSKSISDLNVCGVFTDELVESYRAKPIANYKEREAVFKSLNCVDRVMVQHQRDPTDNLKKIHQEFPDAEIILIHGDDLQYVHGSEYVKSIGGKVVKHPYYSRLSNFKVISHILEQKDKFKDIIEFTSYINPDEDIERDRRNKTIIFSKANTLKTLKNILKKSYIEDLVVFTIAEWEEKREEILCKIRESFSPGLIVLRRSRLKEDIYDSHDKKSFESVFNIDSARREEVETAVEKMIYSYQKEDAPFRNQIFIQRQTASLALKGTIFPAASGKPYYVINYEPAEGTKKGAEEGTEEKEEGTGGGMGEGNNVTLRVPTGQAYEPLSNLSNKTFAGTGQNETETFAGMTTEIAAKILPAVGEIIEKIPNVNLSIEWGITKEGKVVVFKVEPLVTKFVHGWGGTLSIQSLECHTLRYVKFRDKLGNAIDRSLYCEIRDKHHTVYFDEKDVKRWNKEGKKLLDEKERKKIMEQNREQISRFWEFYERFKPKKHETKTYETEEKYENEKYRRLTNQELEAIFTPLLTLVMENGSFFPYSREETIKPVKDKIISLLSNQLSNQPSNQFGCHSSNPLKKEELFQILTTPAEEDIFLREQKGRRELLSGFKKGMLFKEDICQYSLKHPWRFVNTYSREKVDNFLREELSESSTPKQEEEISEKISRKINRNKELKERQEKLFAEIKSPLLRELCLFLQDIALLRLENKNVWAGYEYLFLDLFDEIAGRIGLSTEEYLYSYRIEDTQQFLLEGKMLPYEEVRQRLEYFNLEISPDGTEINYKPKYSKELNFLPPGTSSLSGEAGNLGKVAGRALIVTDDSLNSLMNLKKEMTLEDIYITTMTHPAMVSILHQAKGIITDEGGVTSHAAIISRELGIPCLVGTRNSTRFFKTGEFIELDANNNHARKLTEKEIEEYRALYAEKTAEKTREKEGLAGKSSQRHFFTLFPPVLIPDFNSAPHYVFPYTVAFPEIDEKTATLIGGKGQSLAACYQQHGSPGSHRSSNYEIPNYSIPYGFCLTRRVYDEILSQIIKERITLNFNEPEKTGQTLASIRKSIMDYQFSGEITKEIEERLQQLKAEKIAVRSSASCEDSRKRSFAGQFKTVLGISKSSKDKIFEEKVFEAIKECLASAFNENAVLYASEANIDYSKFYMAVVVQEFIDSEKSGVLFSRNPADQKREGFWIEANFGVGESVVSGEVKPDQYFVSDFGSEITVSRDKEVHSYDTDGELEISRKDERVLSDEELQQLKELGKILKETYNREIEYEWCFFGGRLHLLQVRPVTALKN